jgi:hypothetical protein
MHITKVWMLIITVGLFLSVRPTHAQYTDFFGGNHNNGMSALMATGAWSRIYMSSLGPSAGKARASTSTKQTATVSQPAKVANTSALRFRPTGTHVKTTDLAASIASTPAEREQYRRLMDAVLDAFAQQAQKAGVANDLAAAFAFFLGENIRIYRGLPDFSDQQYLDLRNGIADALVSNGAINNLTDRQKQEMYETLVAYTGITQYGYEQGVQAKNDGIIKGYQKVAGQSLQAVTKMSPDTFTV